jgi:hypothetical protein
VSAPTLWSIDRPYLYRAVSRLECDGEPCDDYLVHSALRSTHAPIAAHRVRLFNGKALVIVQARLQPGVITLSASAEGLGTTTAQIELNR